MSNHDAIGRHRFQITRRIKQCFAFRYARCRYADVDGVGRQSLGCNFERCSRSGRRFEEKVNYCAPAQGRDLFDLAFGNVAKRLGRVEQMVDLIGREFADAEEVLQLKVRTHKSCQLSVGSWQLSVVCVMRQVHAFATTDDEQLTK